MSEEPFAKPSKISDFFPLNGFFLNSVLGMGTCLVYAGIDNTQQQEVNPCPLRVLYAITSAGFKGNYSPRFGTQLVLFIKTINVL